MLHQIFLYDCEACQMPDMINQKVLQLEPVLGNYGACKLSHTFPKEKPFNFNPLKLPSKHNYVYDMYVVTTHQCIVSAA